MSEPDTVFQVVFVCTGNRFRSVLAEHQLRRATHGLPVLVSSLGTYDEVGAPALSDAVALGAEAGLDLGAHRSRTLLGEDLSGVDLVVGFERNHVASAVVEAGSRRERTFGAYELAELLARVEPPGGGPIVERAREAVSRAHEARAQVGRPFHELADPVGRGRTVAAETAEHVAEQTARIAFGLFDVRPSR